VLGAAGAGKSSLINKVILPHRPTAAEQAPVSDDIVKDGTERVIAVAGEFIDTPGLDSSDFSFSNVGDLSPCLVVLVIAKHVEGVTVWLNRFTKLLDHSFTEQKFFVVWTHCEGNTSDLDKKQAQLAEKFRTSNGPQVLAQMKDVQVVERYVNLVDDLENLCTVRAATGGASRNEQQREQHEQPSPLFESFSASSLRVVLLGHRGVICPTITEDAQVPAISRAASMPKGSAAFSQPA